MASLCRWGTGLKTPLGVEVLDNNLFVANYNGSTVREYDASTGALINANFITGLSLPQGLAISDVPEPSTWTLLLVGTGAQHLALRRRSRA